LKEYVPVLFKLFYWNRQFINNMPVMLDKS